MAKKNEKPLVPVVFETATEAAENVEGRKKVYECYLDGAVVYAVASSPIKAAAAAYFNAGWKVIATSKKLSPAQLLAGWQALSDEEKKELKKHIVNGSK